MSAISFGLRQEFVCTSKHALGCARFGCLGSHALGLIAQSRRLLLGISPLATPPSLVDLSCLEVLGPPHRVLVDFLTLRVEVPNLVDGVRQQFRVMADHDESARIGPQEFTQPTNRVRVEMVGGLIQQEDICTTEQNPRQLHTSTLATGQGSEGRIQNAGGKANRCGDRCGFRFSGVTTECQKLRFGALVSPRRLVPSVCSFGYVRHRFGHSAKTGGNIGQATGIEDPITCQFVGIGRPGVLRQVAHCSGSSNVA